MWRSIITPRRAFIAIPRRWPAIIVARRSIIGISRWPTIIAARTGSGDDRQRSGRDGSSADDDCRSGPEYIRNYASVDR